MNINIKTSDNLVKQSFAQTSKEKKTILKARAKALALEPEREKRKGEYLEVVEFLLAYETYAIETAYVREVYPLKELTVLPCTPPFVLGIINVRGQILSVIDIKKFFDRFSDLLQLSGNKTKDFFIGKKLIKRNPFYVSLYFIN